MKHVVNFSGGIGSWAAAKRVVERHGTTDVVLLFANTKMEDTDTYRFLTEAAANVGVPITYIEEGSTPWELFFREKFLPMNGKDLCSRVLKRDLMDQWREFNCDPADTIVYVGIDWTEIHRLRKLQAVPSVWRFEAPLCEPPYWSKEQMHRMAESEGLKRQRLYELGFEHANCGGFCIKAGQGHFLNLLAKLPERYAEHEAREQELIQLIGADRPMGLLRDRRGGQDKPMTLRQLREREQAGDTELERDELGGCGCALE